MNLKIAVRPPENMLSYKYIQIPLVFEYSETFVRQRKMKWTALHLRLVYLLHFLKDRTETGHSVEKTH